MSTGRIDPEQVESIVRRKMLFCAFDHWIGGECDIRIAAFLQQAGMFKPGVVLPDIEKYVVEAFCDPDHHQRLPLEHSPVILVKAPGEEQAVEVVSALELLCALSRDAREASLVHLGREPSFLTPLSQRVLAEYTDDIRATDIDRWLPAAMRAEQVLDSDFKLNLAGFRIGGQLRNQELQQHCWLRLVRHSLESLLSISDDGYRLIKPAAARNDAIAAMMTGKDTALQALSSYDDALGHLPLHAHCDIGAAMKTWLQGRAPTDWWDSLREWCSSSAHPLRTLQAATVAVTNQSFLPPAARGWLQDTLRGLVAPRDDNPTDELNEAILQLEADCARYYFRFIELRVPNLDVDRVATVSWWAARQIAEAIAEQARTTSKPSGSIKRVHEQAVQPLLRQSELEWHAGHPRSGDASIRIGTMFCSEPRILALLIRLAGSTESLASEGLSREDRDAITGAFVEHQIGCFPIEAAPPDHAVWAFDAPLAPAFNQWIALATPPEDREKLTPIAEMATAATDAEWLVGEMSRLGEGVESTRSVLSHLFRIAAYCRSDAAEPLWQLAMDPGWRKVCFEGAPSEAIQALFEGIIEVSRRVDDERVLELPHIFAEQHENCEGDQERRSWFFATTVLAATAVGRVSAVRRIVDGPIRDRDLSSIEHWREQVRQMLPLSPPVLQGTLRDVLSSLTPV